MMHDLDLALRCASAALLLLLGVVLLRAPGRVSRLAGLLSLNAIAFGVTALSLIALPLVIKAPLAGLASACSVMLLMFSRSLFEDDFRPGRLHLAAWLGLAVAGTVTCTLQMRPLADGLDAIGLIVNAVTLFYLVRSWPADLIEQRRRARLFIAVAALADGALLGVGRVWLWFETAPSPALLAVVQASLLFVVVLAVAMVLLSADGTSLFDDGVATRPRKPPPADEGLANRLDALMREERLYRHETLAIGKLAQRLGVPDHRLRQAINGQLGHRNFNAFINGFRLDEVKVALADPEQQEVPITTIALDAGFGSLGPFNRAFRADTGMTPSQYRKLHPARGQTGRVDSSH